MEAARPERVPRVDAERAAVAGAIRRADERVAEDLGLPAGVRDGCPLLRRRAVAEGDALDLDRQRPGPGRGVERVADHLTRNAERARGRRERRGVPDLPDE